MIKTSAHIGLLLIFLTVQYTANAQLFDAFLYQQEQNIAKELKIISEVHDDYVRQQANARMIEAWEQVLLRPNSFDYEFASVKISKLRSQDEMIRIITWNLPQEDGTFLYFGYLQYWHNDEYRFRKLVDKSEEIQKPEKQQLAPHMWYGALYYDIVEIHDKHNTYYTLLGWDGYNSISTHKVIDVVHITQHGQAAFGANIFDLNGRSFRRLIFRYADRASFTLRYEQGKKMIVFDHLSPTKPQYTGMYEYYGPDMTHDGLRKNKGRWQLDTLIDIRSPRSRPTDRERKYSSY